MRLHFLFRFALGCLVFPLAPVGAQDSEKEFDPFSAEAVEALERISERERDPSREFLPPGKVRELTDLAKPSLVTVRQLGRDGKRSGTGSGFIVSEDGLVVTNLHVIGEGRAIEVELFDGKVLPVVEVFASDRRYDLAVIRIDAGETPLEPLVIGDSGEVRQGDLIVGFGAPQGLAFSVVPGAISAIRKLEPGFIGDGETPEFPMLQLAMPIEQGNSGGPVINLDGEVLGIVTLRHRVTENLGFAVPSNDLKALLEKPNPVPMSRWRTIGTLNPGQWTPVMGAEWSQRGGTITSRQMGEGFGGRSLCLSSITVPEIPFEVSVTVKLNDESGAAGLTFCSNGEDVHYGFYPSDGKMRLTRFEGPDVYSWTILAQVQAPSYVRGGWNVLRVRVEAEKIHCWVNEEKVLEIEDNVLRGGSAGLCKFRQTVADFRQFRIGPDLSPSLLGEEDRKVFSEVLDRFLEEGRSPDVLDELGRNGAVSRQVILEKVGELESLLTGLRSLETEVYRTAVSRELIMALDREESDVDLFEVGLQVARLDEPELDLDHYRAVFSQLVGDSEKYLAKTALEAGSLEKAEALRDFLFKENGFHGSRSEYYNHANSYVNQVLDDREGLPITLSVVYLEMARRLRIVGVFGAALPGKFMVGLDLPEGGDSGGKVQSVFFDLFDGGKSHTRASAAKMARELTGTSPEASAFRPTGAREIAVRMLRNLVDIEVNRRQTPEKAENYLELILAIQPDAAYERFQRAILRVQASKIEGAREDLDWLLENRPPGLDYGKLEQFRESLPSE